LMALFPFRKPTTSEIEYFGANESTKWIWSAWTFPSNISTFFHSHNCLIISRTDLPTSPLKNSEAVLRTPDYMVFTLPNRMC
jgi:hypothetical protein